MGVLSPGAKPTRCHGWASPDHTAALRMQQFLYWRPLLHGHGSLRPTLSLRLRIGSGFLSPPWLLAMAAACCPCMLSAAGSARGAASCVAAPIDHSVSW